MKQRRNRTWSSKRNAVLVIYLMGIVAMILYSALNISTNNYYGLIVNVAFLIMLSVSSVIIIHRGLLLVSYRIAVAGFVLTLASFLVPSQAIYHQEIQLWLFLLPLVCFFVFGRKEGVIWSLAGLLLLLYLLFSTYSNEEMVVFSVRAVLLYSSVMTVMYFYESVKEQREEELLKSQEQLSETSKLANVGGWEIDLIGNTIRWTSETFRIYELPEDKMPDVKDAIKYYHSDDQQTVNDLVQRAIETGDGFDFEARLVTANNNLKWVRAVGKSILKSGINTAVHGMIQDITERKKAEYALAQSEAATRNKLKTILEPEGDINTLGLGDIIDTEALQSMMEDCYQVTGLLGAVQDISGNILVAVGWQDICSKFHRCHPETLKNCNESDAILSKGVPPGTFKAYKCKNNMWDVVTPLMVGGRHVGNVWVGQFFYEDEVPDVELFREQARQFGFDEKEYLAALDRVPRYTKEFVEVGLQFYAKIAGTISTLSFSAITQSRMLTERKRAEEDLQESERRLIEVQKMAQLGHWSWDIKTGCVEWSEEVYRIFRLDPADFIPAIDSIMALSPWPEENARDQELIRKAMDSHEKGEYEQRFLRPDGSIGYYHSTFQGEYDEGGNLTTIVGTIMDITERKQAEEELSKHRDHLEELVDDRTAQLQEQNLELHEKSIEVEEANRLKSEFLSNMSHELRTPLNSIMTLSSVLARRAKDKLNDEENSYLEIVERNGKKLLELVNDILDLSKIEAGKIDVVTGEASLSQLLGIIKDNLTILAEKKGLTINLEIPKKLPVIETDEARLHQVFTNVIGNAVKFTEKGSVDIIVKSDTKNVYVDIKDTGIGISEKELPHIFDEFRQVDGSHSRHFDGTGLGLAIAYKMTKLLGATIRVKSKLDKGSEFTVTIPIKWMGETDNIAKATIKPTTQKEKKAMGKPELHNVLIVEDNPDNMTVMKAILNKDEFKILEASDGEDGLNKAIKNIPDIILLDMSLPKMNGKEVVKILKSTAETKNIPVIAVTASAMKEDEESFLKAGCDDFIAKPIDQDVLLKIMDELLG